ncbi:hypothetical protein Angca_006180 [Angiostrongylus cantonensis]|nr:hypothetical protein Angca_006180 [Angiostrongylus cantonensis]
MLKTTLLIFCGALLQNGLSTTTDKIPSTTTQSATASMTDLWTVMNTTTTETIQDGGKGSKCRNRYISDEFRDYALRLHNYFRSVVARGLARNGEYRSRNAPSSSRMYRLEYDCRAEHYAYNHVKTCDKKLLPPHYRPGYEENIHLFGLTYANPFAAFQNAFVTWTSELRKNGIPWDMIFTYKLSQRRYKSVVRVTKIIWGNNRHVGCATYKCRGFYFTSCMYRKPVNVIGEAIYKIGEVCSSCPGGWKKCNKAVGLCSIK